MTPERQAQLMAAAKVIELDAKAAKEVQLAFPDRPPAVNVRRARVWANQQELAAMIQELLVEVKPKK